MADEDSSGALYVRGGENGVDHEEVWDDSELVDAYERAMASARAELSLPPAPNSQAAGATSGRRQWRVGDACRARYTEDGVEYEAQVVSVAGGMCEVEYVGYKNRERLPCGQLMPSEGKKSRRRQEKQAAQEAEYEADAAAGGDGDQTDLLNDAVLNQTQYEAVDPRAVPSAGAAAAASHSMGNGIGAAPAPPPWMHHWPPAAGRHHPQQGPAGMATPRIPPPPPPPNLCCRTDPDDQALASMLMSWYISGYHTGYYAGRQDSAGSARR